MPPKKQKQQEQSDEEGHEVVVQKKEFKRTVKQIMQEFYNLDTNPNANTNKARKIYMRTKLTNMDISQKLKLIEDNIGFKDGVYCCWKISEVMNFQMKLLIEDVYGFKQNLEKAYGDDGQGLFKQLKKQTAKQIKADGEKNEDKQGRKRQRGKKDDDENEEVKEKKTRRRRAREDESQNQSFVEERVNEARLSAVENLSRIYRQMGLNEQMDTDEEDQVIHKFSPQTQNRILALRAQRIASKVYDHHIFEKSSESERLRILSRQSVSEDGVQSNKSSGEDSNREPILKVTQQEDPGRQRITQSDPSEGQVEEREFPKSKFELQQELIQKAIIEHQLAKEASKKEKAERKAAQNQPKQQKKKVDQFFKIDQDIHITAKQIQIVEKIQKIEKYNESYKFQRMADEQARDTEKIRAMAEQYNQAKAQKLAAKKKEESRQERLRRNQDQDQFDDEVQDSPRQYNQEEVSFKNKGMTLKAELHQKVIRFNQFAEKSNVLFGDSKAQAFYSLMIMARTGQAKIEDKNKNRYKFSELYIQLQ
ncbi:hypothetical protein pb186bvf_018696 [Paramecium bursaria]